jgi:plastocyanin
VRLVTALRAGDIVTLRARVIDAAAYDNGEQQVMVQLLPNGKQMGWLLQKEVAFEPDELLLKVGDRVRHKTDDADTYEVMALFPDKQVAIRKLGNWPISMTSLSRITRL